MNDLNLTSPPPSDAASSLSSPPPTLKHTHYVHPDSASTHHPPPPPPPPAFAYYYPGSGDADGRGYYIASDAPVIQAENGGFMYVLPAFQPGYNSYSPYLPFGIDGQYVCQLPYSPTPLFQPSGYYPDPLTYADLLPSPYPWDPSLSAPFTNAYTALPEIPTCKYNASSMKNLHSHFSNLPQTKSSLPSMDVSSAHAHLKSTTKAPQNGPTFQSQLLGKNYFALYNQGKGGVLYSNTQARASTRGWDGAEKPKTKGHVSDFGLLGPRTTDDKGSGGNAAAPLAVDGNGKTLINRDQYNLSDFPTKYDHAFFFVIKSYSEDDIHKSIKYNVWASTPNGNKRLDGAYEDAQDKTAVKGCKCPVFLFFSVNASGQFCGIAEMIGRVDFNRNMDFWQQDKWNGFFPVKWHILKDVPNPQLRHIILENNDNKPVTNSRDTQEVRFPQGTEMLNIFKNYASKTSILDDFEFYESRQKVMQEKKMRPSMPNFELLQKADELTSGFQSVDLSAAKKAEEPCKE